MPIDSSIAMGYRGVDIPNPLNAFAQMQQIQAAQQNNALGQMRMDEMRRGVDEHNRLLSTLSKFSPETKIDEQVNQLQRAGFLKQARDLAESHAKASKDIRDTEKSAFEVQKLKQEDRYQRLRNLASDPSDDRIVAHLDEVMRSPLYNDHDKQLVNTDAQALLTKSPEQRANILRQYGASASDLKPQNISQNLGGSTQIVQVGPTGQPKVINEAPVTSTPHQKALEGIARQRLAQGASQPAAESDADTIDFLAEGYRQTGQLPPLGMGASAGKMRNQILSRAAQLAMGGGKTASEAAGDVRTAKADTASAASTVKDFSSGVSARRVTANNTAINHLATMEKLASDLNNSDIRVVNAAGNAFAKATGAPAPTSFDAARQLVASEVVKAVVNNGGGVTERQEAEEQFARANSPEQLKAVIGTYKELLAGQLDSLGKQYEVGSGRKDFDKRLTPETRKVFEGVRGKTATLSPVDQQALEWATANPTDPRSAQIKSKLGVK